MLKREGSLLNREVIEAPASYWGVERAYYLNNKKTMILLLKDNIVMRLDNEKGFSNEEVVNISKEQLGL
jgi:cupin superfamily acireductone dioxygenase involved in methionine salvage